MTIRHVKLSDADKIAEIYKYYVDNFPYSFEYSAPDTTEFINRITEVTKFYPFFVCENKDNDELLGFAYAHEYKKREAYKWICETTIYVKPNITYKGIGTLLYNELLPALKNQGFTKAFAVIGCPNESSERFHEKMNFNLLAAFPDMGYKHDCWHDVKYYVYDLNPVTQYMNPPISYLDTYKKP